MNLNLVKADKVTKFRLKSPFCCTDFLILERWFELPCPRVGFGGSNHFFELWLEKASGKKSQKQWFSKFLLIILFKRINWSGKNEVNSYFFNISSPICFELINLFYVWGGIGRSFLASNAKKFSESISLAIFEFFRKNKWFWILSTTISLEQLIEF